MPPQSEVKRIALYARVSTSNGQQDPEMQLRELREYARLREVMERLRGRGGDLENGQIMLADADYPTSVNTWKKSILDLLQFKAECDVAVVLLDAKHKREDYINTIIGHLEVEFLEFLVPLREGITQSYEVLNQGRLRGFQGQALEEQLEPLKKEYRQLCTRVSRMQPTPGVYHSVQRLRKREEKIMSKYEFHGPVGAAGDNAVARDFNQIWN